MSTSMTLNDLELPKNRVLVFFGNFRLWCTFHKWIAPTWLDKDLDNLQTATAKAVARLMSFAQITSFFRCPHSTVSYQWKQAWVIRFSKKFRFLLNSIGQSALHIRRSTPVSVLKIFSYTSFTSFLRDSSFWLFTGYFFHNNNNNFFHCF